MPNGAITCTFVPLETPFIPQAKDFVPLAVRLGAKCAMLRENMIRCRQQERRKEAKVLKVSLNMI